ncbi:hypothetical protein EJ069_10275 [Mesorhizobium sp. M2A.F.Ca.ET.043.05.1.1]|uniref:hypothetical protein n=1 Tax=Mesorhizobium sp. M2A.F.Ca.ET.043.05.1.1 TaxID=2493671 RepID=UPI000F755D8F|nr:hypothetical protein [Mesorhizobium sp. M2A.F.Ca.ET.043.05.1.1]AZO15080.1 hypothetical protein EJ069_10275 [Mesorhizobium sp. M2A.F.Ca.ET.043.05.1.1]
MSEYREGEIGMVQTGGVPHGVSAFEHHQREVVKRAIRLQMEREARKANREVDQDELRRRLRVLPYDSPLSPLLAAMQTRKPGLLARIASAFGWDVA